MAAFDPGGDTNAPPPEYGVKFDIPANNTDHAITYTTSNGGSITQQPGAPATVLNIGGLSSNTPISLTETTSGVQVGAGGVWESSPSGSYSRQVGSSTPVQTNGSTPQVPAAVPATAPTASTSGGEAPAPKTIKGDVALGAVWTPKTDVNTGTQAGQSTSDFTIQAYREGVDKQVAADREGAEKVVSALNSADSSQSARDSTTQAKLDALNASLGVGNTAANTTNEKLESIKTNTLSAANTLGSIKTILDNQNDRTADTAAANAAYQSAETQSAAAKIQTETAFSARSTRSETATAPGGSSLEISLGHTGYTLNLDPMGDGLLSTFATWCKSALAWLAILFFEVWTWKWFSENYRTVSISQQAKGNTVAAGTGGQATSLVAALAITAAIVGFPTAYWALVDSGFTESGGTNPFSGGSGGVQVGLYWLWCFVPVSTLLGIVTARFVITKAGLVLLASVQAVIRFIVP